MITDAIFAVFRTLANAILGLLPDIEPPDLVGAVEAIAGVSQYFGWLNKYFPIAETIVLLALVLTVAGVMYGVRFVMWVVSVIWPGAGSAGAA